MPKLRFQRSDPQAFCVQKALALNTKYTMLENTVDGVARDVYFYLGKIRLDQQVFSLCHYWPILFPFCQQIPDDPCRFIGQGIASNYSCSLD